MPKLQFNLSTRHKVEEVADISNHLISDIKTVLRLKYVSIMEFVDLVGFPSVNRANLSVESDERSEWVNTKDVSNVSTNFWVLNTLILTFS